MSTETPQGVLGSWENGPKQTGSREQDGKKCGEQGAEESNLGSMEHIVCHKIVLFYTRKKFRLVSL